MSQLLQLLEAVKDHNLTKTQLEQYRDSMVHLHTSMQLELAEKEKACATFFLERKVSMPEASDISIKRIWKGTENGLREIELNRFIKAVAKEIDSLKSRLYSIY